MEALRDLAPLVLGVLVRRYRDFAACEDAVQEALVAAARQWPATGVPENPRAWLVRVAARRLTDEIRAATARRLREELVVAFVPVEAQIEVAGGADERDDTLELYFMCCHPALSPSSQIALTLRAVGGLTTAEVARAFLVPEATMAQRLSRAKQTLREAGSHFEAPDDDARARRGEHRRPPPRALRERARLSGALHRSPGVEEDARRVPRARRGGVSLVQQQACGGFERGLECGAFLVERGQLGRGRLAADLAQRVHLRRELREPPAA